MSRAAGCAPCRSRMCNSVAGFPDPSRQSARVISVCQSARGRISCHRIALCSLALLRRSNCLSGPPPAPTRPDSSRYRLLVARARRPHRPWCNRARTAPETTCMSAIYFQLSSKPTPPFIYSTLAAFRRLPYPSTHLTPPYTQVAGRRRYSMQLPDSQTPRLPDSLPMTDRPKNLSYLTPTSVMNSMESTRYTTHILTPLFRVPARRHQGDPECTV
jgi:hypothetical protein